MSEINDQLSGMLFNDMSLMKMFNKDAYADAFNNYFEKYRSLFSEIEAAIRNQHGHLVSGSLMDDEMGNLVGTFSMECDDEESYKKVIKSIRNVPNVIKISPAPMG